MTSKSVEEFEHECDRRQPERQTDHATEKCLAIVAKVILPDNNKLKY